MTRRLGFEQWMAIAVALLIVAVILGAGSAGLARAGFFANDVAPGASPTATHPGAAADGTDANTPRDADDETSGAVTSNAPNAETASGGSVATTTTAPASTRSRATTTAPASGATTTMTTTTTTTTTAPPPPPPPPPPPASAIQYYAGNTADFCARLSGVRTGAGLPALASCSQTSALQSVALQFAQAKSVWHTGTNNEIVGYTYKEMSGLVANFAASAQHYAIITAGAGGVTARVGCYYREDPADLGARYIFCIAQFA